MGWMLNRRVWMSRSSTPAPLTASETAVIAADARWCAADTDSSRTSIPSVRTARSGFTETRPVPETKMPSAFASKARANAIAAAPCISGPPVCETALSGESSSLSLVHAAPSSSAATAVNAAAAKSFAVLVRFIFVSSTPL